MPGPGRALLGLPCPGRPSRPPLHPAHSAAVPTHSAFSSPSIAVTLTVLRHPYPAMAEYGYTELDIQYSPRFWVRRMHEKVVVENHIQVTNAESERVRAEVPYRTLRYGAGPREAMDEFGADSLPADAPVFVFIHGGYWQHLSKEISCYLVQPLFDAGIRVVVVGYDLAPDANMTEIVNEIKHAGSLIMERAQKLKARAVWFSGFSAGGHLTGVLLNSDWMGSLPPEQSQLIKGFLPISGIFDVKPIVRTYINGPLQMSDEEAERNSPMDMIPKQDNLNKNLKVLAIFGQYDSPAFHMQSKNFVKKLQERGIEADCFEVPDMDHFNLVENLSKEEYILTKTIISIVKSGEINKV